MDGSPLSTSVVQESPSSHELGHELGGSQVSTPAQMYESPHEASVHEFRHASVFSEFPSSQSSTPLQVKPSPHEASVQEFRHASVFEVLPSSQSSTPAHT